MKLCKNEKDIKSFFFLSLKQTAFLITKMSEQAVTKDLWIGLNGLNQEGFYWTDGKARQYTNWGTSVSTHI